MAKLTVDTFGLPRWIMTTGAKEMPRITIPSIEEESISSQHSSYASPEEDWLGECDCTLCREARGEVSRNRYAEESFDYVPYADNIADILTHGDMQRRGRTPIQGINETGIAEVTYGDTTVKAIYKYCGTSWATHSEAMAELAVRWVAERFPHVCLPAVVMRDYEALGYPCMGQLQHFIPDTVTAWEPGREYRMRPEVEEMCETDAWRTAALGAALFDMLIGNSDRHGYNWLVKLSPEEGENPIVLIDHGGGYTFSTMHTPRTIAEYANNLWGMPIPQPWRDELAAIADDECAGLYEYLDHGQVEAFRARAYKLANWATYQG